MKTLSHFSKLIPVHIGLVVFTVFSFTACNQGAKAPAENISIQRFDQDLFLQNKQYSQVHFDSLFINYKGFYQSFCTDIINIPIADSANHFSKTLLSFVQYPGIISLKKDVDSVFQDLTSEEAELSAAISIYKNEIPKAAPVHLISFISEFGYANVAYDTIIGIGLDLYLGANYPIYPALEFPAFMVKKLQKAYLVPNTVKALGFSRYEQQVTDKRFLAMLLFEGKIKHFTKTLLPETSDTLIFGISAAQLKWCQENEAMIWAHLIQEKLLYSKEANKNLRYFNDGPFTSAPGVPPESAPAIGTYLGYQIIQAYLAKQSNQSLNDLMNNNNWDEILKKSNYHPKN
jgi:hypothetical protein